MLVLARTLIARPSCLLIDEISLGLGPTVVRRLIGAVKEAARAGTAVLLVEQFMSVALDVADVVSVLVRGEAVLSESTDALREDPRALQRAYMGAAVDAAGK